MLNNAVCVNSIHKLRFAQDLALYNLDLSEAGIGFDGEVHRDVWQNDPVWQGVRENVENLTAIGDWAEAVFATNVVYESLVGVLFRSHLVMQIAARNGDYVTPTIVGAGENDYARDLNYTRTLFSMLVKDAEFGEANKAVLQGWLDKWIPQSLKAARALQPIWSQPLEKIISFETSLDESKDGLRATLADLGLTEPKELSA